MINGIWRDCMGYIVGSQLRSWELDSIRQADFDEVLKEPEFSELVVKVCRNIVARTISVEIVCKEEEFVGARNLSRYVTF